MCIRLATTLLRQLFVRLMGRSNLCAQGMRPWPELLCVIPVTKLTERRIDPNNATECLIVVQAGSNWQAGR